MLACALALFIAANIPLSRPYILSFHIVVKVYRIHPQTE